MTVDRLTFQSFQRDQAVLRAINALSTHLKLLLSGAGDEVPVRPIEQSVETLRLFLRDLDTATREADLVEPMLMLGVDTRLQKLVQSYLTARRYHRFRSRLFTEPITGISELLTSTNREDRKALVRCLAELRVLLEEHMHDDASQILGAI